MGRQLSQNLKALLQDVGEGAVLMNLALRLYGHPEWRVFRNYAEAGCDLLLLRTAEDRKSKQIKVEVKTRQNVLTDRASKNAVHFTLSQSERDSADFLVAYWFERNDFFVVPTNKLHPINASGKKVFKFIAYLKADGTYNESTNSALGKWDLILDKLS